MEQKYLTVGDLREAMSGLPDETLITIKAESTLDDFAAMFNVYGQPSGERWIEPFAMRAGTEEKSDPWGGRHSVLFIDTRWRSTP